ncbi:unnamed protein product (macronuclear) [Paramecium tetraurelia]|uniref:UBC core domain-containing protein n=1 Tax=Paramecium tetraurelia TaxID=5888 RepID=A0BIB5_PARTE|nr:uncharacterized protein GSPATT00004654001 [Paramecium tetraurelia]CAK58282.1 unnamed protein product [Paramecium tetraurelia]|eukprot:XP_001425680.1 hypothetical protein (macronuclear) [Paramecium tetraurelia strain d4-2]
MAQPTPRIIKETQNLAKDKVQGIDVTPDPQNFKHFFVIISGPPNTPYEGGVFDVELLLPDDYPMYIHPNVFIIQILIIWEDICLDVLKDKWSPALQIRSILLQIQVLLSYTNPSMDDPLNIEILCLWKANEGLKLCLWLSRMSHQNMRGVVDQYNLLKKQAYIQFLFLIYQLEWQNIFHIVQHQILIIQVDFSENFIYYLIQQL